MKTTNLKLKTVYSDLITECMKQKRIFFSSRAKETIKNVAQRKKRGKNRGRKDIKTNRVTSYVH